MEWTNNFVAFMDNMLQLQILLTDTRSLYVPTGIEKLIIDPQTHFSIAKKLGDNPQIPVYVSKESMSIRLVFGTILGMVSFYILWLLVPVVYRWLDWVLVL